MKHTIETMRERGIIKDIIRENLSEDGYDFTLDTVQEIVDANIDYSDDERETAYAKGYMIFADCLNEYALNKMAEAEK